MKIHMVADHAIRPAEDDIIFGLSARAGEKSRLEGPENIINSTMGVLTEDDGEFVAFKSVYKVLKELDNKLIAGYASLAGDPAFLRAAEEACFMDHRPKGFITSVATPGGTGAVRHAVSNFTHPGDTFITANWFWSPYQTIADENGRKLDTFNLFNDEGTFDFESYKSVFEHYLSAQKRLLVVLNTPAHNPTGYTISDEEWDKIIDLAVQHAQDRENRIVFMCDVAYIDFSDKSSRCFMEKFGGLDENIITLFAYSASKSYTMYGLRNGAMICVTSDEKIAEEVFYSCAHSNRGTWSNGTRGAMQVLTQIDSDPVLYEEVEKERNHYRALLKARGDAFLKASEEIGLKTTNYKDGFFVSIPCSDPVMLCEKLIEGNLFTVPLQNGIRIAICSVSEEKCRLMPGIIAGAINELNG